MFRSNDRDQELEGCTFARCAHDCQVAAENLGGSIVRYMQPEAAPTLVKGSPFWDHLAR